MSKLTREALKRFPSISYSKAKELGITDEDLVNISELPNGTFRVKITCPKCPTPYNKVFYTITDAINDKWKNKKIHDQHKKKNVALNKIEQNNQYRALTVRDGFSKYFEFRKSQIVESRKDQASDKGIQRTSYEKDVINFNGRLIRDNKLLNKKIIDVTKEDAQEFVDTLNSTTLIDSDELLSVNTRNNAFALVHKVFNYFKDTLKIVDENPFSSTEGKPMYKRKNKNYLANVDIQYVLDEVEKKNIRFKAFVNFHLETGARIEEIAGLKYSDINRMRMTIKICRAVVKSRLTGELIIKDLKTSDSEREISISDYTLSLIDNYRTFKRSCGIMVTNDDFIFTSWVDNELVDPKRFSTNWKDFITALGYEDLPLEVCRHSALTFTMQGTTNLEAVRRRFGWSKLSTVMESYHQSNLEEDRKLLDNFNEEFRNLLGLTYDEMFRICIDRFNNQRKLKEVIQKLLLKPIEMINFDTDLEVCKKYLMSSFPIFNKLASISSELDDEEIRALLVGFKSMYKKIKIEPLGNKYITQ